jgi:hypothetical protein
MRRSDVSVFAFAVAAGILGVVAHTGPLFPGLAVLVAAGLLLRARTAHYIVVSAVAPLLVWATWPDVAAAAGALALAAGALCALLLVRERPNAAYDAIVASRVTLAAAMVVAATGLLSFDLLLR